MSRDNLLFVIIGILLGFIAGFMLASGWSQRDAALRAAVTSSQADKNLPPNHPPLGSDQTGDSQQQVFAQVQESMKRAREEPDNFEAQFTAAKLEYQIRRFDQAIEYLLRANQLRPKDFEVLAWLGMVNMDAGHLDAAEKWYRAALLVEPKNVPVLDGLCSVLLSAGKTMEAEETINKLARVDPTNEDLPQFRDKLAELKAGKK